jgi:hypothetical protein
MRYTKELYNLYPLTDIGVTEPMKMRWLAYVERKCVQKFCREISIDGGPFGTPIITDLREIGWEIVDCMQRTRNMIQWRVL